jgi:hypothetical protein
VECANESLGNGWTNACHVLARRRRVTLDVFFSSFGDDITGHISRNVDGARPRIDTCSFT